MKILKNEIIGIIRKNKKLKRELIEYFDISEPSLYRMLHENDSRFTQLGALEIIVKYLDYKIDITEMVEETANTV